ncbi:LamG-like jellyroll fold domain-containing protein [Prescottella agglutinans]|uniref:LamG-like jellyroll fold domain-containing protein n=1 Tax=Prescottella agglutinans TaxID=1644129 RepID=UPI003D98BF57
MSGVSTTRNRFDDKRSAYFFDGFSSVLTIPDHDDFSATTTGYLSISVWVRPEGVSFDAVGGLLYPCVQGSGYVHWFGKGTRSGAVGNREWAFRIYSADNAEGRHNRMSFYLFPYQGGLGPGCYVEDAMEDRQWLHLVAMVSRPDRRIWLYKDGLERGTVGFGEGDSYPIADADFRNGGVPIRMGSQDGRSYFRGAIDNVYFYNRLLGPTEIASLYSDTTP